jgi:hypothetical protein
VPAAGPTRHGNRGRVYLPVPVTDLAMGVEVDFDLYVHSRSGHSTYLRAGTMVSRGMVEGLVTAGIDTLYVTLAAAPGYTQYTVEQARAVLADQLATPGERAGAVRRAVGAVARELAEDPTPEAIQSAQRIVEMMVAEVLRSEEAIAALLRITYVEYSLHAHMVNCAIYTLAMCGPLGVSNPQEISGMGMAGLLFDIGLALYGGGAPAHGDEDPARRRHTEEGREMLVAIPGMPRVALDAALYHHERWDGEGYPAGLRGVRIPLAGRVAAVVDAFDAMTTAEAGGRGQGLFATLKRMRDEDRGHFAPDVLRALIAGLGTGNPG